MDGDREVLELYNEACSVIQQNPSEARRLLENVVSMEPEFAEARINLASILRRSGEEGAAAEHYRRVAELCPQDPRVWVMLADCEADLEKAAEAGSRACSIVLGGDGVELDVVTAALVAAGRTALELDRVEEGCERLRECIRRVSSAHSPPPLPVLVHAVVAAARCHSVSFADNALLLDAAASILPSGGGHAAAVLRVLGGDDEGAREATRAGALLGVRIEKGGAVIPFGVAFGAGDVIRAVQPGSLADKSGIRPGMRIVNVNGSEVESLDHVKQVLRQPSDFTLDLEVPGAALELLIPLSAALTLPALRPLTQKETLPAVLNAAGCSDVAPVTLVLRSEEDISAAPPPEASAEWFLKRPATSRGRGVEVVTAAERDAAAARAVREWGTAVVQQPAPGPPF
eukprot:Hpha_TRINITY_DN18773_c0_g1::TRINITY_DN18773_c0_g1_i1::g.47414::m.47414